MTLILTIANTSGIYQSSDYQLTNRSTRKFISDRAGSKQLQATFKGLDVSLAFTGVADIGFGPTFRRTIDWLSEGLRELPPDSNLQQICDKLKLRCSAIMKPPGDYLELVLAVAEIGKRFRVAVISNIDRSGDRPLGKPDFAVRVETIRKHFVHITGFARSVTRVDRARLRAMARDLTMTPQQAIEMLSRVNETAAKNSAGAVSEGCWVITKTLDGTVHRSTGVNVREHGGEIPLMLGGMDLADWVKQNFRMAPGRTFSLRQSAGVMAGPGSMTPMPAPCGEPRTFILDGTAVQAALPSESEQSRMLLDVSGFTVSITMRCNEEATLSFGNISLSNVAPIVGNCARPLLPWPEIHQPVRLDDTPIPRGTKYSVGYWIENGNHHLVIPQTSRGVRNLAFLGPDDEFVIVTPTQTLEFTWSEYEAPPIIELSARVQWRSRFDGTRD